MSSTLICGERDAVLVDTLVTFDQVDALADWIDRFDKNLTDDLHHAWSRRPLDRTESAKGSDSLMRAG